jgi:hypothetical protein
MLDAQVDSLMIFQHLRRRYNVQKARIDLIKAIDQAYAWSDSQFTSLYLREVVDQSYCLALLFLHSEPRCLLPPSAWSEWGKAVHSNRRHSSLAGSHLATWEVY